MDRKEISDRGTEHEKKAAICKNIFSYAFIDSLKISMAW
jgi:hypothetical protein